MRLVIIFLGLLIALTFEAKALDVKHHIATSIGFFDACEETFSYTFYDDKDYDVKTKIETKGTFGTLYPFRAEYHSVGTLNKTNFMAQDYFSETFSKYRHRTKEIVYQNGTPIKRISTKDTKKRVDEIIVNPQYEKSNNLLTIFAKLAYMINKNGSCDLSEYEFNGKVYSHITVKKLGKEKIKTPYFAGRAIKCQLNMKDTNADEAGFLLKDNEPIYLWILQDDVSDAYFLAKIEVKSTPFGKLEALTTKIEVTK